MRLYDTDQFSRHLAHIFGGSRHRLDTTSVVIIFNSLRGSFYTHTKTDNGVCKQWKFYSDIMRV